MEEVKYVNMTNIGPLAVKYKWNFIVDEDAFIERDKKKASELEACLVEEIANEKVLKKESVDNSKTTEIPHIEIIKENHEINNTKSGPEFSSNYRNEKNKSDYEINETLVSNSASDIIAILNQENKTRDANLKENKKLEELILQENKTNLPSYEEVIFIYHDESFTMCNIYFAGP